MSQLDAHMRFGALMTDDGMRLMVYTLIQLPLKIFLAISRDN